MKLLVVNPLLCKNSGEGSARYCFTEGAETKHNWSKVWKEGAVECAHSNEDIGVVVKGVRRVKAPSKNSKTKKAKAKVELREPQVEI